MSKQIIQTDRAPAAIGPYSQAVKAGNTLYVSGQLPINPESGDLVEGDIKAATRQSLENLQAIVEAAGMSLDQVVKCEVFLEDMADFAAMNEVYSEFFTGDAPPARQAIQAARLPKDAAVEISCIAHD